MNKRLTLSLLVASGVLLGVTLALLVPASPDREAIEWLENPRALAPFSLQSNAGEFNEGSLTGHWTVVLFGFLNCPDVCPTGLARMGSLAERLAPMTDARVSFVFVSVDPARDSLENINTYVTKFHPSFVGVTGSHEDLVQFAGALGVQFRVRAEGEVAHSTTYSIIDPSGSFRGRFRPGFDVTGVAGNLARQSKES